MTDDPKPKNDRSPNHPSLSLPVAVDKTKLLYEKYQCQAAPLLNACVTLGYKSIYSTSNQAIAALRSYGLINILGIGPSRKIAVTAIGQRIIRGAPDRDRLIKSAALMPSIHREVLKHFFDELPHDEILKQYLVWERPEGARFNPDAVDGFIQRLRETLSFADLAIDDKESNSYQDGQLADSTDNETDPEANRTDLQVGSFVQWTSNGQEQFKPPRKILAFSDDGEWAFVEGSNTGVPVSELTLAKPPTVHPLKPSPPNSPFAETPKSQDFSTAVLTNGEGPYIRFPLSNGNRFELRLEKRITAKDFERLKKLIELSEDSLVIDE